MLSHLQAALFANTKLTFVAHANLAMLLQKAFFSPLYFDKTFVSHLSMELLSLASKSVFRIFHVSMIGCGNSD